MVNNSIAIIPARGGSKRIPQKNVIDFFGKPMISWTIEAALESHCFEKVIVSTDDERIAEISRQAGADVPFMRVDKTDDFSPISEATLVALNQAECYWSQSYDIVCQLMANCPLRTAEDIRDAFNTFKTREGDFQISCFKYGWMNPWWSATLDQNMRPQALHAQALSKRSQDLKPLYCPTGAIWLARSEALKEQRSFYGEGHTFHPLSWVAAVDIDENEDLDFAKAAYLMQQAGD